MYVDGRGTKETENLGYWNYLVSNRYTWGVDGKLLNTTEGKQLVWYVCVLCTIRRNSLREQCTEWMYLYVEDGNDETNKTGRRNNRIGGRDR